MLPSAAEMKKFGIKCLPKLPEIIEEQAEATEGSSEEDVPELKRVCADEVRLCEATHRGYPDPTFTIYIQGFSFFA